MPDNRELYGTSDILWREIAPKLFELSNRQPAFAPPTPPTDLGSGMSAEERKNFDKAQAREAAGYASEPNPPGPLGMKRLGLPDISTAKDRAQWRKGLRNFRNAMKDPSADLMGGIGELVDSGVLYWNDNPDRPGWYTRVRFGNTQFGKDLAELADRWSDLQAEIEYKFGTENDPESIRKREEFWKLTAPIFQNR